MCSDMLLEFFVGKNKYLEGLIINFFSSWFFYFVLIFFYFLLLHSTPFSRRSAFVPIHWLSITNSLEARAKNEWKKYLYAYLLHPYSRITIFHPPNIFSVPTPSYKNSHRCVVSRNRNQKCINVYILDIIRQIKIITNHWNIVYSKFLIVCIELFC